MDADLRRWWCPACMRIHGLGEVLPFKQNGMEVFTCRETGAIMQAVEAPTIADTTRDSKNDEQHYWCPGCMRFHTSEEVTPFTRGSEHGMACRLTGAVVEVQDVAAPSGHGQPLVAKGETPFQAVAAPSVRHSDPNVQTAAEMGSTSASPPVDDGGDRPVTLDAPADDRDN